MKNRVLLPNLRSNNVHLSLRQALRLRDLASADGDKDLCRVADRVISPKTCTLCGNVNEGVSRNRSIGGYACKACCKAVIVTEDRM